MTYCIIAGILSKAESVPSHTCILVAIMLNLYPHPQKGYFLHPCRKKKVVSESLYYAHTDIFSFGYHAYSCLSHTKEIKCWWCQKTSGVNTLKLSVTWRHHVSLVQGNQSSFWSLIVTRNSTELAAHSIQMMLISFWGWKQAADYTPSTLSLKICMKRPATIF